MSYVVSNKLDSLFKHFKWYLANDSGIVGLQSLNRSPFIHADFRLDLAPKKKIYRYDVTKSSH